MEPVSAKPPLEIYGNTSSLAIFTHIEVKRRESDDVAFHKRMKFAEIPRDIRLSQLVDTVLRVLKCSDYNSQRRTSCFLCLPSWKPQRLCDVVLDPHKANAGAVLGPVAHLATLYIAIINEELPPHNLEAIQSFIKFYIKLCRVDCQSLSSFITQHNFPLSESDILSLICDKPIKPVHLTLADLTRCNEWCARIMQTHHAVTNYFMRPNAFLSPHPLSFVPGEEMKQEPLSLTEWHPHSPSLGMKSFASAMSIHTGSGGAVLNQHTPLLAHPASHSPHDANDYFNSVLSQRLMSAPQQASTPTSAVNLAPNATTSVVNTTTAQPHLYSHPRTPVGEEMTPGANSVSEQRKKPQRMRTSFDADYELPYLMTRFKDNPNPTKESMEEIKQILNNMPSRKTKRKLDLTNIMYWFKNMRAGFRKRERLNGSLTTDRQEGDGSGDNSHQRLDRMDEDEDEDDEEDLDDEDDDKKRHFSQGRLQQSDDDEQSTQVHVDDVDGISAEPHVPEENKENVMKREDALQMTVPSPPEDEEQDDDTEIIEGRPEDFRDEEEEASTLPSFPPSDHSFPEDLSTSRPHPSLGPLPPLRLPLPPLMTHRHPGAWQQPIDGATAFAYLTQRVMARNHSGGQIDSQSAASSTHGGEMKTEVGLEVKHNGMADEVDGGSNDSMLIGSSRKRKRTRVFIDPTTEVPKLKEWFLVDTHPTAQMIELYTSRLNAGEYRNRQQPLEPKNVQLWFKNHRAKVKRRRLNESGQETPSCNPGFLPPLLSQSTCPDSSPGNAPLSPSSSDEQPMIDPGCEIKESVNSG